jgi:cytochrome c
MIRRWVALALVAGSSVLRAESGADSAFEEAFRGRLSEGWKWIREDAAAWKLDEGALHVRTLPGSLWEKANNAVNVLVRPAGEATDKLSTEVKVASQPKVNAEQAGLLWYLEDANYIKLVREIVNGKLSVAMVREENEKPVVIRVVPAEAGAFDLRLRMVSGRVRGEFRTSETAEWQLAGDCASLGAGELMVGLFAGGGEASAERWARFERFQMSEFSSSASP